MFFFLFPENGVWHFTQIVSIGTNLHEMSNPGCWESKKNISIFLLKILDRVLSVKYEGQSVNNQPILLLFEIDHFFLCTITFQYDGFGSTMLQWIYKNPHFIRWHLVSVQTCSVLCGSSVLFYSPSQKIILAYDGAEARIQSISLPGLPFKNR